jgi:DNA adenine methylase
MHVKPLKWAGSKDGHADYLRPIQSHYSSLTWYDPFCGSLALPLKYRPQKATLLDINPRLINFWRWVQRGMQIPAEILVHDKQHYYEIRDRLNALPPNDDSLLGAAYFYYLCRTGFNGLCRFSRKGKFNVPFGEYKSINYCSDFSSYVPLISGWYFDSADFLKLHIPIKSLLFIDPPYWRASKPGKTPMFVGYAGEVFGWEQQERTAFKAADYDGPVICCNSDDPKILELYHHLGFKIRMVDVRRRISCAGDRPIVQEMLAFKNIPDRLLPSGTNLIAS